MVVLGKLKKIAQIPPASPQEDGGGGESSGGGGADADTAKLLQSISDLGKPATQSTPMPGIKDNVWRNVFEPGSTLFTKAIGKEIVDKDQPNSPTT